MKWLKKIISVLKNPQVILIVFFIVWMLFFDEKNAFFQIENYQILKNINASKQYYKTETEKNFKLIYDLENNPQAIEKYAREHYFMHKPNEDVYLIQKESPAENNE